MGSKKNRRYYRNQHRFTFHRKRPSWKRAQDSIPVENRPPAVEVSGSSVTIDGFKNHKHCKFREVHKRTV